ncbi:uncharacterized protein BDW47DRAFT_10097 [Aspergillus candidus]|uniref:Uncharacterized protein n=1 Tax=Aspergillus candidus TaxID=41067 RepID=A0A2I2EXM1_ASPCN|nr:hypothetical protein BDW47DRAFT_10097 [Aspergillus candidus]PLB33127.1 hypothetical protein BDW47DRAFT_10097 [Aspergillus candidus]
MSSPDFIRRLSERISPNNRLLSNPCSVGHAEPSLRPLDVFVSFFCCREFPTHPAWVLSPFGHRHLTHPGLACIDLRPVSRNGPRMLCCANKLLTNPPHAMTDTTRDSWKGTCSTSKAHLCIRPVCINWPRWLGARIFNSPLVLFRLPGLFHPPSPPLPTP